MDVSLEASMRVAIAEGELARGSTGDNPWVGCIIVDGRGAILGRGHTQGPGEDHAEIAALREAKAQRVDITGATMVSTLEPCSFHGRTPACSRVIAESGIRRVVVGMRDPHPRVDGEGIRILRSLGIDVIEGVCEAEVRRQLGAWVLSQHPHEMRRRARLMSETVALEALPRAIAEIYAVDTAAALGIARSLDESQDA
jgi:diaminohydroxyphosphoribosylaminopyrimidine deaminase / 5-amino-6-(5-phosphoribosylamino)uracil reductase